MTIDEINLFYGFLKSKGIQHNFDYFYRSYKFGKKKLDDYLDDIEADYVLIDAFDMNKCSKTIYDYNYWEKLHHQWLDKLSEYRGKVDDKNSDGTEKDTHPIRCSHCGRMLPESAYNTRKNGKLHANCRECETGEWDRKRREMEKANRQKLEVDANKQKLSGMQVNLALTTKVCSQCGKRKLRSEFYSSKTSDDGLQSVCKTCQKEMEIASAMVDRKTKKEQTNKTNETMIENNEDFTFYDFGGSSYSNRQIGEHQFAITNKNRSYRITMSVADTKNISRKNLSFVRLRKDNATGALHLLFNRTTGVKCTVTGKSNINVNNKELVQFLIKILGYKESDERVIVDISEDLSRTDEYATFLIKQK